MLVHVSASHVSLEPWLSHLQVQKEAVQSGVGSRVESARDKLSGKGRNLMGRGSTKPGREGQQGRERTKPKMFLLFVFI